MAQPSLSTLCSICYTHPPKYRCPGCQTRTCSLPCNRTHKLRATCTGRRDPAAYVKKSQLATPAGVDRDYNYLKSVERSIQDAHERDADSAGDGKGRGTEGAWRRYLAENGIQVVRAPRGMSRARGNGSRVTRGGAVFWTVEWCFGEGREREVRQNAMGSSEVGELWRGVLAARRKRKAGGEAEVARGAKRRRASSEHAGKAEAGPGGGGGEKDAASSPAPPPNRADDDDSHPATPPPAQTPDDTPHFYLLKPSTPTPTHVLIPLSPTCTLTHALSGQTVHEYPTIYVLSAPAGSLPAGFITAEEYEAQQLQRENRRGRGSGGTVGESEGGECKGEGEGDAPVDAKAILDMLKRDVRG